MLFRSILASHLQQTAPIHQQKGNPGWGREAGRELITALRDDYPVLIDVLRALADAGLLSDDSAARRGGES